MTTYAVTTLLHGGPPLTLVAPGGLTGDFAPIAAQGSTINALVVVNGATPTTVTLTPPTFDGMTVGPRVVTVAANAVLILPLSAAVYGPAGQNVPVSYGNTTTLTGGATGVTVITIPAG